MFVDNYFYLRNKGAIDVQYFRNKKNPTSFSSMNTNHERKNNQISDIFHSENINFVHIKLIPLFKWFYAKPKAFSETA